MNRTDEKKELRQKILEKRNTLNDASRISCSEKIFRRFCEIEEIEKLQTFFLYLDFGSEVQTEPFINYLFHLSKTVAVPRTIKENHSMEAVVIDGTLKTVSGAYGIREPDNTYTSLLNPVDIDCVLLPGAVFDRYGGRIGYGGGYYDRFLGKCRSDIVTIGAAYAIQVRNSIPQEDHDVRLKYIITEKEVFSSKLQ